MKNPIPVRLIGSITILLCLFFLTACGGEDIVGSQVTDLEDKLEESDTPVETVYHSVKLVWESPDLSTHSVDEIAGYEVVYKLSNTDTDTSTIIEDITTLEYVIDDPVAGDYEATVYVLDTMGKRLQFQTFNFVVE